MRGGAATEGLELLQRGCEVIKFSQKGKPSVILLRLSADEKELSWHRHGLSKLKLKTERRALQVEGITDLLVGRESAVFQKQRAGEKGAVHLSLSLVLAIGRESFDLSCADEEQFGYIVAAIRALLAERSERVASDERKALPWGGGLARPAFAAESGESGPPPPPPAPAWPPANVDASVASSVDPAIAQARWLQSAEELSEREEGDADGSVSSAATPTSGAAGSVADDFGEAASNDACAPSADATSAAAQSKSALEADGAARRVAELERRLKELEALLPAVPGRPGRGSFAPGGSLGTDDGDEGSEADSEFGEAKAAADAEAAGAEAAAAEADAPSTALVVAPTTALSDPAAEAAAAAAAAVAAEEEEEEEEEAAAADEPLQLTTTAVAMADVPAGLGSAAAEAEALFAGLAEDEQNAEDEADALFRRASRGVDIADEDEERVAEHLRRGLALADGGLQLAEDLFAEQQTAAAVNTNPFGQSTAHAKPNRRTAEEAAADLFGSAAPTAAGPSRRPKATNPFGADASPPSENPFGAPASSRRSSRGPSNPFGAPASRQAASGGTKNPFAEAPPAAETAEEAAARLMAEIDGI